MDPESLINEYYPRMLRTAFLFTGNLQEAEDLAHETALQAMKSWSKFEGRSDPGTWLYSIAFHVHGQRQRSETRRHQRLENWVVRREQERSSQQPDKGLLLEEWTGSLWSSVARLPDHQKHVVVLRYSEGLSVKQIASVVNCAEGTVKSRLHHALRQLKQWLREHTPDQGDILCNHP